MFCQNGVVCQSKSANPLKTLGVQNALFEMQKSHTFGCGFNADF
jgi:hypothetical protein